MEKQHDQDTGTENTPASPSTPPLAAPSAPPIKSIALIVGIGLAVVLFFYIVASMMGGSASYSQASEKDSWSYSELIDPESVLEGSYDSDQINGDGSDLLEEYGEAIRKKFLEEERLPMAAIESLARGRFEGLAALSEDVDKVALLFAEPAGEARKTARQRYRPNSGERTIVLECVNDDAAERLEKFFENSLRESMRKAEERSKKKPERSSYPYLKIHDDDLVLIAKDEDLIKDTIKLLDGEGDGETLADSEVFDSVAGEFGEDGISKYINLRKQYENLLHRLEDDKNHGMDNFLQLGALRGALAPMRLDGIGKAFNQLFKAYKEILPVEDVQGMFEREGLYKREQRALFENEPLLASGIFGKGGKDIFKSLPIHTSLAEKLCINFSDFEDILESLEEEDEAYKELGNSVLGSFETAFDKLGIKGATGISRGKELFDISTDVIASGRGSVADKYEFQVNLFGIDDQDDATKLVKDTLEDVNSDMSEKEIHDTTYFYDERQGIIVTENAIVWIRGSVMLVETKKEAKSDADREEEMKDLIEAYIGALEEDDISDAKGFGSSKKGSVDASATLFVAVNTYERARVTELKYQHRKKQDEAKDDDSGDKVSIVSESVSSVLSAHQDPTALLEDDEWTGASAEYNDEGFVAYVNRGIADSLATSTLSNAARHKIYATLMAAISLGKLEEAIKESSKRGRFSSYDFRQNLDQDSRSLISRVDLEVKQEGDVIAVTVDSLFGQETEILRFTLKE